MGMGHVPAGPIRQERQGDDVPRRQYRGTRTDLGSLANRNALGSFGESVASRFLTNRGASIVGRNVRVGRGELDLIVSIDDQLVAVEVKSGSGTGDNDPIYHFDEAKQHQVRSLARQRGVYRVDYIGVAVAATGVTVRWLPRVC